MRRLVWGQGEGCGGAGEREHRSWLGRPPRSPGCPRRSRHAASSLPWRLAVAAAFDSEHADTRGVKKVLRESWLKCDALLSFLERHERVESRKREEQNRQHSAHRSLPVWSSGKREIVGHHVSRVTRHPSEGWPDRRRTRSTKRSVASKPRRWRPNARWLAERSRRARVSRGRVERMRSATTVSESPVEGQFRP